MATVSLDTFQAFVQNNEQRMYNLEQQIGNRIQGIEGNMTTMNATMGAAQSATVSNLQDVRDQSDKVVAGIKVSGEKAIEDIQREFKKHEDSLNILYANFLKHESGMEAIVKDAKGKFEEMEANLKILQDKAQGKFKGLHDSVEIMEGQSRRSTMRPES